MSMKGLYSLHRTVVIVMPILYCLIWLQMGNTLKFWLMVESSWKSKSRYVMPSLLIVVVSLQCRWVDLVDTFNIPHTKGAFPHMFNVSDNYNYVGKLSSLRYYDPDGLKEPLRTQLIEYHKAHKNDVFDFAQKNPWVLLKQTFSCSSQLALSLETHLSQLPI